MAFAKAQTPNKLTPATAVTPIVINDQGGLNDLSELISNGYMGAFYTVMQGNAGIYLALQDYFRTSSTHKASNQIPEGFPNYIEWKIAPKKAPELACVG